MEGTAHPVKVAPFAWNGRGRGMKERKDGKLGGQSPSPSDADLIFALLC